MKRIRPSTNGHTFRTSTRIATVFVVALNGFFPLRLDLRLLACTALKVGGVRSVESMPLMESWWNDSLYGHYWERGRSVQLVQRIVHLRPSHVCRGCNLESDLHAFIYQGKRECLQFFDHLSSRYHNGVMLCPDTRMEKQITEQITTFLHDWLSLVERFPLREHWSSQGRAQLVEGVVHLRPVHASTGCNLETASLV